MENYTFANNSIPESVKENGISEWTRYSLIAFMVVISLVGIPGNVIVISVQYKLRVKTSIDFYVLTMACFDLLSATVNTSCYIIRYQLNMWTVLASVEICRLHAFSLFLANISTSFLLTATAFDRYRRMFVESSADMQFTVSTTKRICVSITVFSISCSFISQFFITFDSATKACSMTDSSFIVILVGVVVVSVVQFAIVVFCYTRISLMLWRHRRNLCKMLENTEDNEANQEDNVNDTESRIQSRNDGVISFCASKDLISQRTRKVVPFLASSKLNTLNNEPLEKPKLSLADAVHFKMEANKISGSVHIGSTVHAIKPAGHGLETSNQCHVENSVKYGPPRNNYKTTTICSKLPEQKYRHVKANKKTTRDIDSTTLMMFLITLVYFGTWMASWAAAVYQAVTGLPLVGATLIAARSLMINAVTNPIFYMIISLKFRENAKAMFCMMTPPNMRWLQTCNELYFAVVTADSTSAMVSLTTAFLKA